MRASRVSACMLAAVVGCAGVGEVEYAGEVRVTSPELIEVSPGVSVVADADEPLFYADGAYWLYRDGAWLRSESYRGGFGRVDLANVPNRVRGIDRPQYYVQYRRYAGVQRHARADRVHARTQRTYPTYSAQPPEHAGVPSTPLPTPPVTSPNDTHGTPMPPGPGGSIADDHHQARGPQSGRGAVIPPGQDRVSIPDTSGPPPRPEDRAAQVRPDADQRAQDRIDQGTPPSAGAQSRR